MDIAAEFVQNWLEDNISDQLYESGVEVAEQYKNYDEYSKKILETFNEYFEIRKKTFEIQIDRLKTNEQ